MSLRDHADVSRQAKQSVNSVVRRIASSSFSEGLLAMTTKQLLEGEEDKWGEVGEVDG